MEFNTNDSLMDVEDLLNIHSDGDDQLNYASDESALLLDSAEVDTPRLMTPLLLGSATSANLGDCAVNSTVPSSSVVTHQVKPLFSEAQLPVQPGVSNRRAKWLRYKARRNVSKLQVIEEIPKLEVAASTSGAIPKVISAGSVQHTTTASGSSGSSTLEVKSKPRCGQPNIRDSKRKLTSPEDSTQPGKVHKSYANVTKASLRVRIINSGANPPVMTLAQHRIVMRLLMRKLDSYEGPVPSFDGHGFSKSGLTWLQCADTRSKQWLVNAVQTANNDPLLDGLLIRALTDEAALGFKLVSVIFPYFTEDPVDIETVFLRLRRCNPGLDTSLWVKRSDALPTTGWYMLFEIEEASYNFLKNINFMPFYMLGRLAFKDLSARAKK